MTVYAITDTKKGRTGIVPTYLQTNQKMQAQKGRTKSALLIWTKSDLSDKVFNSTLQYGPDLVLGISDLVRFTPIW